MVCDALIRMIYEHWWIKMEKENLDYNYRLFGSSDCNYNDSFFTQMSILRFQSVDQMWENEQIDK